MRPRKFTKIDLSGVYAFRVEENLKRRSEAEMMEKKRSYFIHKEVVHMFRTLGTNPTEPSVMSLGVSLAPTKDVKLTVKETKVSPTLFTKIKRSMIKTSVMGQRFIKQDVFYRDTFTGIDWDNFRRLPEEEFESLKDCYII
jgi:hypothetical protein